MDLALALVGAYILGSIDFAVIVARMRGVDIRQVGSGNPGASNVLRTLGRGPAVLVLVGDTLKGVLGAAIGMVGSSVADPMIHWAFAGGLAAVIGHCYPIFHRFRGGRGVATGLGVLLFTIPALGLGVLLGWYILVKVTKVAAVASLATVFVTVPLAWFVGVQGLAFLWFSLIVVLIIFRHKDNISRLIRGSEQKVTA
jgi:acyl phosphate:glycerol-3-phosphate acyltransferase